MFFRCAAFPLVPGGAGGWPRAPLTFSHRSGVTPYTSSYEFAGSCVFDKQSLERL